MRFPRNMRKYINIASFGTFEKKRRSSVLILVFSQYMGVFREYK